MQKINTQALVESFANLLDDVAAGEEIIILRHGRPATRLRAAPVDETQPNDMSTFRDSLPPAREPAAHVVRELRNNERY